MECGDALVSVVTLRERLSTADDVNCARIPISVNWQLATGEKQRDGKRLSVGGGTERREIKPRIPDLPTRRVAFVVGCVRNVEAGSRRQAAQEVVEAYFAALDPIFATIAQCEDGRDVSSLLNGPSAHQGFKRLN